MNYIVFIFVIFVAHFKFLTPAHAAVWSHDNRKEWNDAYLIKYSNWVSSKLGSDFFKSLGAPYSSLRLDCADAHYVLLAYFAQQEGLPFVIDNGRMSNSTNQFDYASAGPRRFVAFAKHIALNYGTESLVAADTYPISFRSLRPGDLFMYKIGTNGNFTRHTYIIKNINPDGTFDVVYSTQANAAAGKPLLRKSTYMFNKAPINRGSDQNRWGFRRAKPAQYASVSQERIPGADFMQYQIADQFRGDANAFFREVKKANQTIQESPQNLLARHMNGICASLKDRIDIVQEAQKYLAKNNQCMDFQKFDTYSTPSRDSGLANEFNNLAYDYVALSNNGQLNQVGQNVLVLSDATLNSRRDRNQNEALTQFCKVQFTQRNTNHEGYTNIGQFFDALFDMEVSYHPNDNVYRRWGINLGSPRTRCEAYYGYQDAPSRNVRL